MTDSREKGRILNVEGAAPPALNRPSEATADIWSASKFSNEGKPDESCGAGECFVLLLLLPEV